MIKRYTTNQRPLNSVDKFTNSIFDKAVNFVKNYEARDNVKKFVAMRSDKGQQSVILYKDDYEEGMYTLLNDRNNYKPTQSDPTKTIAGKSNKFINKLYQKNIIDKNEKFKMTVNNAIPPKIYGLVKTHKPNVSKDNIILRPVVSYIGSPLYQLSGYLGRILSKSLQGTFNVKNSYEFHKAISNKNVPAGFVLASFDVVSLFTCIPQEFLLECIDLKWENISKHTNMDIDTFKEAVELCLKDSFFVYNGKFYYQISGTPMGAPISSALANLAMEVMLEKITDLLPFELPFLYIFVDDILTAIPEAITDETLEIFNAINGKIQFTIELEHNRQIPFLDLKLTHEEDGCISTEFYQKPSASGRILNFLSNHSAALKTNTAIGLIKRIYTFSSGKPEAQKRETAFNILHNNKFPKSLIHKLICEYKNKRPVNSQNSNSHSEITPLPATSIRYIQGLTERICQKIRMYNKNLVISTPPDRSLQCFFTKLKDKTPDELLSQLIYSIPCSMCLLCYIGLTWKQYFDTRIVQHDRQQRRVLRGENCTNKTAITEHVLKDQHQFDFSRAKIIDKSRNYHRLKVLEMLHISSNEHSCNFRSDVSNTIQQYQSLIMSLKRSNLI
jgi:hypothetical protein